MDRYVKQDLLYYTRSYDLYQAFDQESGELKFYYELKPEAYSFAKQIRDSEAYFPSQSGRCGVVITRIYPGGSVMQLLSRQRYLRFSRVLMLKWVKQLLEYMVSDPVRSPTLDNIFINTRLARAYFVPGSFLPLFEPANEFVQRPTLGLTQIRSLCQTRGNSPQAISPLLQSAALQTPCYHNAPKCDACKFTLAVAKLYTDAQAAEQRSLQQMYAQCESDAYFSDLYKLIYAPHCRQCCPFKELYVPQNNGMRVNLTCQFVFGFSVAQILCNYQIPNFLGVIFALLQAKATIQVYDLIPNYSELPSDLDGLVQSFFVADSDLRTIARSYPLCERTATPIDIQCEYRSRRSNTMTIAWTVDGKRFNQYVVLDDKPDAVVSQLVKENQELACVDQAQLMACLEKAGSW